MDYVIYIVYFSLKLSKKYKIFIMMNFNIEICVFKIISIYFKPFTKEIK